MSQITAVENPTGPRRRQISLTETSYFFAGFGVAPVDEVPRMLREEPSKQSDLDPLPT